MGPETLAQVLPPSDLQPGVGEAQDSRARPLPPQAPCEPLPHASLWLVRNLSCPACLP